MPTTTCILQMTHTWPQTSINNRRTESNNKTKRNYQSLQLLGLDNQSPHDKTDQSKNTSRGINAIIWWRLSEGDYRWGGRKVSHQQQSFSRLTLTRSITLDILPNICMLSDMQIDSPNIPWRFVLFSLMFDRVGPLFDHPCLNIGA